MHLLLALFIFASLIPNAYAQRAVTFDGLTVLTNSGGIISPTYSISGVVSYWYRATNMLNGVIVQSVSQPHTALEVGHFRTDQGAMYLRLTLNGNQPRLDHFHAVGSQPLRYDGLWHHVAVTWDVSRAFAGHLFAATYTFDGELQPWDSARSQGTAQPFTVPYHRRPFSRNWWLVGAGLREQGTASIHNNFIGDLAEVYVHIDSTDYKNIVDLRSMLSGFASKIIHFPAGPTEFGPLELGWDCEAPFGSYDAVLPAICLRGNAVNFAKNFGGTTAFGIAGSLITAQTDPFSLWK